MEGEKVPVNGGDSGDEYDDTPLKETFTAKLLFFPSGKNPTQTSGTIVYATTAIICKEIILTFLPTTCQCKNNWNNQLSRLLSFLVAILITLLCVILANCLPELMAAQPGVLVPCIILTLLCAVCVIIIWRQPESKEALTFKVKSTPSEQSIAEIEKRCV